MSTLFLFRALREIRDELRLAREASAAHRKGLREAEALRNLSLDESLAQFVAKFTEDLSARDRAVEEMIARSDEEMERRADEREARQDAKWAARERRAAGLDPPKGS